MSSPYDNTHFLLHNLEPMTQINLIDERFAGTRTYKKPTIVMLTDIKFWEPTLGSHARVIAVLMAIDTIADLKVLTFNTVTPAIKKAFQKLKLSAELISYKNYERPSGKTFKPRLSKWASLHSKAKDGWTQAAFNFLNDIKPDFVIIEYADRSYLLDAVQPGVRTILDAHDVMSQRALTFARVGKIPSIVLSAKNESELLSQYTAVMAISPHDADVMHSRLGLTNVLYTPHPTIITQPPVIRDFGRKLLFIGGNTEANQLGLQWFLDQVWPIVAEGLELHVVGTVCNSFRTSYRNVVMRGVVDDLSQVHHECDIAINPVFVGGGIKIKTLDAMSFGLPCVTTTEGARGLEETIGTGLLVARKRLEFANFVLRLASSKALRVSVSAAAQRYARMRHAPSVAFRDLITFITHARP
jgi:glycosyltransferase involved in cell wall biosynthesis